MKTCSLRAPPSKCDLSVDSSGAPSRKRRDERPCGQGEQTIVNAVAAARAPIRRTSRIVCLLSRVAPKPVRLALLFSAAVAVLTPASEAGASGRVVVLGFDGADAHLVERVMDEGMLLNLVKLRTQGSYSPLLPTNPAQTPVSWSSFATGTNPGRTQIFDFLKRVPRTYIPTFAMNEESKRPFLFGPKNPPALGGIGAVAMALLLFVVLSFARVQIVVRSLVALATGAIVFVGGYWVAARFLPVDQPWAINNRKGDTFWGLATASGREVEVFRVPATFPAEALGVGPMV